MAIAASHALQTPCPDALGKEGLAIRAHRSLLK
jgi:hypothetical protein